MDGMGEAVADVAREQWEYGGGKSNLWWRVWYEKVCWRWLHAKILPLTVLYVPKIFINCKKEEVISKDQELKLKLIFEICFLYVIQHLFDLCSYFISSR